MKGYWIVRGSAIKDEQAMQEYARLWKPLGAKYSARLLAGRGELQAREGKECKRALVIEFPSYEQAIACYEDPDYQTAMEYALKAYDRELIIIEGS